MQQNLMITSVNLDELLSKIEDIVRPPLLKPTPTTKQILLSRKEVASLLKISLPTLHSWTKHGILKAYKIGNRVLFKQDEIELALNGVSKIKHKRNVL